MQPWPVIKPCPCDPSLLLYSYFTETFYSKFQVSWHLAPAYFIMCHWQIRTTEKRILKGRTIFFLIIYLFIYFWLCWVFVSVRGLCPVAASGGHSSSRCAGLSLSRPLLLRSTDSRRAGSVIVAHGPRCSAACGILPDQGPNPCPLHWQADSQPLRHQGSPGRTILNCWKF